MGHGPTREKLFVHVKKFFREPVRSIYLRELILPLSNSKGDISIDIALSFSENNVFIKKRSKA